MMNYNKVATDTSKHGSSKKNGNFIYILVFLIIWGGLIYGGFYFAKQYLDQQIANIQQTNALHIQEIKERMDSLTREMIDLKSDLSNTDKTLSSSSSIQEQLNDKIELLDKQLKNLEKSLQILKEAP